MSSADGSLVAVLGASPVASTSPVIVLRVLEECFKTVMASSEWKTQLAEMIPAYGINLAEDTSAYDEFAAKADALLKL